MQLGGACETEFFAETFEEMAEKSKQHSMAMLNGVLQASRHPT